MVGSVSHVLSLTVAEATTTTAEVGPNEWNSVHSFAQTLLGNTAGFSSALTGLTNVLLAGGSNLTLSGTTDASSNATISICGPQLSMWSMGGFGTSSATNATVSGVVLFQQFELPTELAISRLNVYASQSIAWNTHVVASTGSITLGRTISINALLYSRGGVTAGVATNTGTIYSLFSSLAVIAQAFSASQSGSSLTASYTITYPAASGTSSVTFSASTSNVNTTGASGMLTTNIFSNIAEIPIPFATTIEPGDYWLGLQFLTSTATGNTAASAYTAAGLQLSLVENLQLLNAQTVQFFGSTTVANNDVMQGLSMAATSATPASSINISASMTSHTSGLYPAVFMNFGSGANE